MSGNEDHFIEVGAAHAGAAFFHDADDAEGNVVDADGLVERIFVWFEEAAEDVGADDDDAAALLDVGIGKEDTDGGFAGKDVKVAGGYAADGDVHVTAAAGDEGVAAHFGGDGDDVGDMQGVVDGVAVAEGENAAVAGAFAGGAVAELAGEDVEQVGAEAGKLLDEELFDAAADAHKGDDGADADDDAEHGEDGAQFVCGQGDNGDAGRLVEIHKGSF